MFLKIQIHWIPFYGKLKNWDSNASTGHTWNSCDASGYKNEFGKEEDDLEECIQKTWTSWAKFLRAQFGGTTTWGNHTDKQIVISKLAWNLPRKYASSSRNSKLRFILLWWRQRHRRSYVYCGFGSFNAQCRAKEIKPQIQWIFSRRCKNSTWDLPRPGDSANKRGSTSFWSRSRPVRNSAITRGNVNDSIAS